MADISSGELAGYLAMALYVLIKDVIPKILSWTNGGDKKTHNTLVMQELSNVGGKVDKITDKVNQLDTEIKLVKNTLVGYDGQSGMVDDMRQLKAQLRPQGYPRQHS